MEFIPFIAHAQGFILERLVWPLGYIFILLNKKTQALLISYLFEKLAIAEHILANSSHDMLFEEIKILSSFL